MNKRSEWREVLRRRTSDPKQFHGNVDDPSITSFFVTHLPGDATKSELWKLCAPLNRLVDVYIAGKKDTSGAFFGFVRFAKVVNPEEMEKGLSRLECRGRKMTVNLSRHP
ncbi:hypothetical protein LXL04_012865 [Taraxacum kok-saghyz]